MKSLMVACIGLTLIVGRAQVNAEEFEALEQEVLKLAAGKAKITAQQAIETASKESAGGVQVEVELGLNGETPIFEIEFLSDQGEQEFEVDAVTGKLLGSEVEKPDGDEAQEYTVTRNALADAKFTLVQAIEAALRQTKGGTVVEAEAEVEDGELEFEVEVLVGDSFKEVEFAADGKVKEVEQEKAEGQAWIFDADAAGKAPAGWTFGYTKPEEGNAEWVVAKDAGAASGPNVLSLKAHSGDRVFNVAMAVNTSYKDVSVRSRVRGDSGKVDQGGGVIWRCKDANNYYICRINPLEGNFRVYKVADGKRTQIESAKLDTESGKWYVVHAPMVGDSITCYVDGKRYLEARDDTFKDEGMVGLWTKADASSSFDNIAVQPARTARSDEHDEHAKEHHDHDDHGEHDHDDHDNDDDDK